MLYREIIAFCSNSHVKTQRRPLWTEGRIFLVLFIVVHT